MKKGKKMSEYSRICHHFSIKNDEGVIELHHIVPLAIGGKNDINNFVCLCANHHKKVHSKLENVQIM